MTPQTIPPPNSVIERLGSMLVRVVMDICGRVSWGGISPAASFLLGTRLGAIKQRIDRIVASIRAGTYKPRRRSDKPRTRASPSDRPARPPSALPAKFGWLMPLIPARKEEYWHANGVRAGLESMLAEPEMAELVAVAPVSLGRPLRSLCWALGWQPPPILARPRKPRTPKPKPEQPAEAKAAPEPDWQPSLPGLPKLPGPRWPKGVKRWRNLKTA
jgi:hypothetical protein